jgi:hypothetical protein
MALKFRVLIQGYDPTAGLVNGEPRIGFWTTRYVEAAAKSEAAEKAVSLVRGEERLARVVNEEWGGKPILKAAEVEQLESLGEASVVGAGYTFFEESDESS